MNTPESKLNRLFAAARSAAPDVDPPEMPSHLKARVLARWRSGAEELAGLWLAVFFRRALVCAAVIMAASVAWSVATDEPDDEVALANYELHAELLP